MATNSQTLKIKFEGDITDIKASTEKVKSSIKGMGVEVSKQFVKISKDGKTFASTLTLIDSKLRKLQGTNKDLDSTRKESLKIAKTLDKRKLASVQDRIRLEKLEVEKGVNSIVAIKQRAAIKEKQIAQRLADDLRRLRNKFADPKNNLPFIKQAAQRNRLIRNYEDSLKRVNTSTARQITLQQQVVAKQKAAAAAARQQASAQRQSTSALNRAAVATNNLLDSNRSLLAHVFRVVAGYRLVNATINGVIQAIKNIPKAGIGQQATIAALTGTFGTEGAAETLSTIRELSDRYGQSITALEESYRKFGPSARLAGASQEEVNQVFEDFVAVGTVLHKTGDEMKFIFTALDQIFAKGVAQSEEMKRQLGNQLPAAIEIGAKAMDLTPAAFLEAMKRNEIIAKEFVPKFSKLYRAIFAGEGDKVLLSLADKLFANYVRILNQYENVSRQIFKTTENILNEGAKTIVSGLKFISENLQGIIAVTKVFAALLIGRLTTALVSSTAHTLQLAAANVFLAKTYHSVTGAVTGTTFVGVGKSFQNIAVATGAFSQKLLGIPPQVSLALVAVTGLAAATANLAGVQFSYGKFAGISAKEVNKLQQAYADSANQADAVNKQTALALTALREFQKESNQVIVTIAGTQVSLSSFIKATWELTLQFIKAGVKLFENEIIFIQDLLRNTIELASLALENSVKGLVGLGVIGKEFIEAAFSDNSMKKVRTFGELFEDAINKGAAAMDNFSTTARQTLKRAVSGVEADFAKIVKAAEANDLKSFLKFLDEFKAKQQEAFDTGNEGGIAKLTEAQLKAERKYQTALLTTNSILLELTGNLRAANDAKIDKRFIKDLALFEKRGDTESIAKIERIKEVLRLEFEVTALKKDQIQVEQGINQQVRLTNAARSSFSISEIESLIELDKLREQEIARLEQLISASEAADRRVQGGSIKLRESIRKSKEELTLLVAEGSKVGNLIKGTLESSLGNAFESFITGAKSAGDAMVDFATDVLKQVARIAANQLAISLIKGVLGLALGGLGSGAGTGVSKVTAGAISSPVTGNAFDVTSFFGSSKGNIIDKGNIVPFKKGGIPDIGSQKQIFPLANGGIGSLREEGPEAILPLARGADGKLGVKALDGAGGSGIIIQQLNVSVVQNEDESSEEQAANIGRAVRSQLEVLVQSKIADTQRSGGILNPTQAVTSF